MASSNISSIRCLPRVVSAPAALTSAGVFFASLASCFAASTALLPLSRTCLNRL